MAKREPKRALALPTSYRQLFGITYRTNLGFLFQCSLWMALFALPLFALLVFQGFYESAIAQSSGLTDEALRQAILSFRGYYGFALLLGGLILSVGLSGAYYAMRTYLRNEGSVFFRDTKAGTKKNAGGFLAVTAFFGGILALLHFALCLCGVPELSSFYFPFFLVFCGAFLGLGIAYSMSLSVNLTYKGSFLQTVRTSFVVGFAKLPYSLLALSCGILPLLVVCFLGVPMALYIGILIYAVFGFGHSLLLASCVNLYCLDETVNHRSFPEIYRMGLFDEGADAIQDEGFQG